MQEISKQKEKTHKINACRRKRNMEVRRGALKLEIGSR